jgi:hypothetical protein
LRLFCGWRFSKPTDLSCQINTSDICSAPLPRIPARNCSALQSLAYWCVPRPLLARKERFAALRGTGNSFRVQRGICAERFLAHSSLVLRHRLGDDLVPSCWQLARSRVVHHLKVVLGSIPGCVLRSGRLPFLAVLWSFRASGLFFADIPRHNRPEFSYRIEPAQYQYLLARNR